MEQIRLQKYFTDCGVLSRRKAEEEILSGAVKVNGCVAELGCKIDPEADVVEYKGRVIRKKSAPHHYILLNKPRGVVTTLSDEKGRTTVAMLTERLGVRVYPVGRLDMDSDGLLLLTDDGALTQRLTHPRHEIPKHYRVRVSGSVTAEQLQRLNEPFCLDGYTTLPVRVTLYQKKSAETVLDFTLFEGRNRQIRRMCEQLGLKILQLTRTAIGSIPLGDLALGHYRHLTEKEVEYLKGNVTL